MAFIVNVTSFNDLKKNLERCDELFIMHQVRLMRKKPGQALKIFEKLIKYRIAHLDIMENILLPVYEDCVGEIPAGAKTFYFQREKMLIERELKKSVQILGQIVLHEQKADLVELFEKYAWLKDLLDHHDAREKVFLFTFMEEKLAPAKKSLLLKNISDIFKNSII